MSFQAELKRKREMLENQSLHDLGIKRRLEGERWTLLTTKIPVNRPAWHNRVTALMNEKMDVLEQLKLGSVVPPATGIWAGFTFSAYAMPAPK